MRDEIGEDRKLYNRLRWKPFVMHQHHLIPLVLHFKIILIKSRWAVPERLLYCPVFKAASTSWLVNFLKLSNRSWNWNRTIAVSLNSHVDLRFIGLISTKILKKNLFRTMNINPKKGNLHKKSVNLFPAPATFKLRRKIFEESTKFIVV